MRAGGWQTTVGVGLNGEVLGVLRLGKLGSEVARVGKAFQMGSGRLESELEFGARRLPGRNARRKR